MRHRYLSGLGSSGDAAWERGWTVLSVRDVQEALKARGFYTRSVTGIWDKPTSAAFQAAMDAANFLGAFGQSPDFRRVRIEPDLWRAMEALPLRRTPAELTPHQQRIVESVETTTRTTDDPIARGIIPPPTKKGTNWLLVAAVVGVAGFILLRRRG
jgi:hypothetical protein